MNFLKNIRIGNLQLYTQILIGNMLLGKKMFLEKTWFLKIIQIDGKIQNLGEYNVEVDAGWVDSSRQAVEYSMDPRNFLNEVRIFQFEALSFSEHTNNIDGVEKILYGTEFYNTKVSYLTSSGQTINMSEKYSDLIFLLQHQH